MVVQLMLELKLMNESVDQMWVMFYCYSDCKTHGYLYRVHMHSNQENLDLHLLHYARYIYRVVARTVVHLVDIRWPANLKDIRCLPGCILGRFALRVDIRWLQDHLVLGDIRLLLDLLDPGDIRLLLDLLVPVDNRLLLDLLVPVDNRSVH